MRIGSCRVDSQLKLPRAVGVCDMLRKVSEQIAECLRRAAEADERAHQATDPTLKADYGRMAQSWRTLARSYEFQSSLGRFISFNNDRQQWASPILAEDLSLLRPPVYLRKKRPTSLTALPA